MKDIGRVHSLEGSQGLVDKVLAVVVGQVLGADDTVHIRLHQFLKVHVSQPAFRGQGAAEYRVGEGQDLRRTWIKYTSLNVS